MFHRTDQQQAAFDTLLAKADVFYGSPDTRPAALAPAVRANPNLRWVQTMAADEPALVEALRSGTVSSAYLDVFVTEPLPDDSPLWDMPNVLVSPHTAAFSLAEDRRIAELFADNLPRYLDGAPLRNVVDTHDFY